MWQAAFLALYMSGPACRSQEVAHVCGVAQRPAWNPLQALKTMPRLQDDEGGEGGEDGEEGDYGIEEGEKEEQQEGAATDERVQGGPPSQRAPPGRRRCVSLVRVT